MGTYEEMKIRLLEEDRRSFWPRGGLDVVEFVGRRREEIDNFRDYAGEYYKKPEYFRIGEDFVYKKKQLAGEVPAEIVLGYAYNELGIASPIAYPFFMKTYFTQKDKRKSLRDMILIPDGVITKDVLQVFPTAEKRGDKACHTIHGLYTDENCLRNITHNGRMSRIKEMIASIAFNNKDAGYDNSFWVRDSQGKYDSIVSIDHGYSGRYSMYVLPYKEYLRQLYFKGEHGYNGMFEPEEDRGTTIFFLKQLLAGKNVAGVEFTKEEIAELNHFIKQIKALDFDAINKYYANRFNFDCSRGYMQGLEWSREDLCDNLLTP